MSKDVSCTYRRKPAPETLKRGTVQSTKYFIFPEDCFKMDESDSPNKNIENEEKIEKRSKKSTEKRVKRKKTTAEGSTEKLRSVRKKSTKKESISNKKEENSTKNSTKTGTTSSDEEEEEIYRSKANLIPGKYFLFFPPQYKAVEGEGGI